MILIEASIIRLVSYLYRLCEGVVADGGDAIFRSVEKLPANRDRPEWR